MKNIPENQSSLLEIAQLVMVEMEPELEAGPLP